jgi:hypothetical protein
MNDTNNLAGTPYDFENPRAYIPPIEFRTLDSADEQVQVARRKSTFGSIGRLLVVGAVVGSALFMANHTEIDKSESDNQQDTPAEQPHNCIEASDELFEERITIDEAVKYYEKTREERTSEKYINYDLLDKSNSTEEISGFLSDYYVEQDIRFHFGELPLSMATPTQTDSAQATHKPNELSLFEYQLAAFSLTDALHNLPPGILDYIRGTDIYVTSSVDLNEFQIGGLYSVDSNTGRPLIVLNANETNSIKATVYHEIGHALHDKMCDDQGQDIEYVEINSDAHYTKNEEEVNFDFFISEYAATNSREDVAEMTQSLFLVGALACYEMPQPICAKEVLLLNRLGEIDQNISKYLVGKGASITANRIGETNFYTQN